MNTKTAQLFIGGIVVIGLVGLGAVMFTRTTPLRPVAQPVTQPVEQTNDLLVFQGAIGPTHVPLMLRVTKTDGTTVTSIDLPKDLVPGDDLKVIGNAIYYLGGTELLTSIGHIDPRTGAAAIFPFTKTANTNVGNVVSAMIAWSVARDGSRLAWMNPEGVVTVAAQDGSGVQTYKPQNKVKVTRGWLAFRDAATLLVWRGPEQALQSVNLADGLMQEVIPVKKTYQTDISDFTLSLSGKKLAYVTDVSDVHVFDFSTGEDVVAIGAGSYDVVTGAVFSQDESKLYASFVTMSDDRAEIAMVNLTTKDKTVLSHEAAPIADVLKDGTIVVYKGDATYILSQDGTSLQKLSDLWYLGELSTD